MYTALKLAPLETFDPEAFIGDDVAPQSLCNLILTLALIYNDCKDIIAAHITLQEARPSEPPAKTWFYFADAAATGYMRSLGDDSTLVIDLDAIGTPFNDINHALMGIVEGFIQKRRFAFKRA